MHIKLTLVSKGYLYGLQLPFEISLLVFPIG
jgi:hypothetical protein